MLGENIPFLIDSLAVANIVSKTIYEMIKDQVVIEKPSKTLYAFGQSEPMNKKDQFHAVVKVQDKSVNALFFVYDGDNAISNLMSVKIARDLSLLHVQAAVSEQNLEGVIKSRYNVLKGYVSLRVAVLRFMLIHSVNQLKSQLEGSPLVTRTRSLSYLSAW